MLPGASLLHPTPLHPNIAFIVFCFAAMSCHIRLKVKYPIVSYI
jgi:hypothetical protein